MAFQEYPKWLHFEGEPSVLVDDADAEKAVLAARKPKRGRAAQVEAVVEEPANDAGGDEPTDAPSDAPDDQDAA